MSSLPFDDSPPPSQSLSEIEQEVRHCFIHEDAPEYVEVLEAGILQVCQSGCVQDWKELLRSAHTLKGGAGLAQLMGLSKLSHRLEDLLLAVREERIADLPQAHGVLLQGIDEVRRLLALAASQLTVDPQSDLLAALEQLLQTAQVSQDDGVSAEAIETAGGIDPVRLVMESDFQQLLTTAQAQLDQLSPENEKNSAGLDATDSLDATDPLDATESLRELTESGQMLAEVLNLSWLKDCMARVQAQFAEGPITPPQAQRVLNYLSEARAAVLQGQVPATLDQAWPASQSVDSTVQPAENSQSSQVQSSQVQPPQAVSPPANVANRATETPAETPADKPADKPIEVTLRVPVSRLNQLNARLGDMFVSYESLKLEHRRLDQSTRALRQRSRQFYSVREQLQALYDQLLLPLADRRGGQGANDSEGAPEVSPTPSEFDALEMDQFSDVHSLLLDFQELLIRLEESRDDITLFAKGAGEAMHQLHEQMMGLRTDLRATRLRPFSILAERFRRPLWDLSQRFGKPVELVVDGGGTLVDRAVLDQLYDPLMHLMRNAFDHGIEEPAVRQQQAKPAQATIRLTARQTGTRINITLEDDGGGIDLERIHAKAQQIGLLGPERPADDLLLSCLFKSGFSTATEAGELSGRGVGLDAVEAQVSQLRGTVTVTTHLGQGTQFRLQIPRSINILPLLVCQQRRSQGLPAIAAIPSIQILDFLPLSAVHQDSAPSKQIPKQMVWREQTIPLVSLDSLMPLSPTAMQLGRGDNEHLEATGSVVIVVEGASQPLAILVEQLLCEQELVLKSFETWVPMPAYLSGCTILPSGEAVPVLRPEMLQVGESSSVLPTSPLPISQSEGQDVGASKTANSPATPSDRITILVVDDSVTARRWMVRSLEREGYQVVQCRDGQEAWEQLVNGLQCTAVVSDVEMPRLDGFQLLSRIRQHPELVGVPVALLTSRQGDRHVDKARKLGATGYYTKPLGNQQLLQQLDQFLSGEAAGLLAATPQLSTV